MLTDFFNPPLYFIVILELFSRLRLQSVAKQAGHDAADGNWQVHSWDASLDGAGADSGIDHNGPLLLIVSSFLTSPHSLDCVELYIQNCLYSFTIASCRKSQKAKFCLQKYF